MAASRVNTTASEFRTILTRIKEVKEKLEQSDNTQLARQLEEGNDSLRIMEGNQTDFADAVFKELKSIETRVADGFKVMEAKIAELEAKMEPIREIPCTPSPTNSGKKRKIARHPDLSFQLWLVFECSLKLASGLSNNKDLISLVRSVSKASYKPHVKTNKRQNLMLALGLLNHALNNPAQHYVRSKMEQLGLLWNADKKENEAPNQEISATLLKEIQEIEQIKNDSLCTERRVLDAISQNYSSYKKRKRQEEKGTYEKYQLEQKRRQRMKRKLDKRIKVTSEEERSGDLFPALHISLVSSDESGTDDDSLTTRPMTWRTDDISQFFKLLDQMESKHDSAAETAVSKQKNWPSK